MSKSAAEKALAVVAGVIRRADDAILLSLRRPHQHQGGLWEFPGGKRGPDETPLQALSRELEEELGLVPAHGHARPLVQLLHRYPDRAVHLSVWEVFAWHGIPSGREGQRIAWVAPGELARHAFPKANERIVAVAMLPRTCLITPEPEPERAQDFLRALEISLRAGMRLVQLRAKTRALGDLLPLAQETVRLCHEFGARVLLNGNQELLASLGADGLHLTTEALHRCRTRPVPAPLLLSAACHEARDIRQARRVGVDFGVLGPVLPTASHPEAAGLGWSAAGQLVGLADFPLFALGGQGAHTIERALDAGFHGVAAISAFWGTHDLPDSRLRPTDLELTSRSSAARM